MNGDTQSALSWRAHPARAEPLRACFGGLIILALGAALALWFRADGVAWTIAIGGGALACLFLCLVLHRFFFPTRYVLDDAGITARSIMGEKHLAWEHIHRFLHDPRGGFLSTRIRPSRFDQWRGMHLVWGERATETVVAIEARLSAARHSSMTASERTLP